MFTLGVDFGTNSVRALVVRCSDGAEYGSRVVDYPSGAQGVLLDPKDGLLARQRPADYLFGLEESVKGALAEAGRKPDFDRSKVIGIGVDTTGSSPIPVDDRNQALASSAKWKDDLNAQCWLWKDHTSWREAAKITELSAKLRPQYIAKCGGVYSSEWFWAKIWHCLNVAPETFGAAFSWVELADWIPSVLAGVADPRLVKRGVCAAGHKGLYSDDWGGLPDKEFLGALDPRLAELRDRLYEKAYDATEPAGSLCSEWAAKLGLAAGIPIAIGEFDVHYGAIGCGVREGALVKVIGTSTCDCAVVSAEKPIADIPGICGIVKGAILPGFFGIEAGQSAVGDIFKWWVEVVLGGDAALHAQLTAEAAKQRPGQSGLLGSRLEQRQSDHSRRPAPHRPAARSGPLYDTGRYLSRFDRSDRVRGARDYRAPPAIWRAARTRLCAPAASLRKIRCSCKSMPTSPDASCRSRALARHARWARRSPRPCSAGAHPDFASAEAAMTSLKPEAFEPIAENKAVYDQLYALYRELHDSFGGLSKSADLSQVMKTLLDIKYAQRG